MVNRIGRSIKRRSKALVSAPVAGLDAKIGARIDGLTEYVGEQTMFLAKQLQRIEDYAHQNRDLLITQRDNIPFLIAQVEKMRANKNYNQFFNKKDPLITVRIATYNRSKLLCEKAIPSILAQAYKNFEIVVVGDHCTDDTEEQLKKFKDPRIRFYNLEQRTAYPEDPLKRWLVVGAKPANKAVEMAKGDWIATIDDDDSFRPNHLETLVQLALKTRSELTYSAQMIKYSDGKSKKLWSDPPKSGEFSMMGTLYLRALSDFIKTDEQAWAAREPQDWNLCRRMLEAGVKYTSTDKITGDIFFTNFSERKQSSR
jgi:hypothetical protein